MLKEQDIMSLYFLYLSIILMINESIETESCIYQVLNIVAFSQTRD